jgi:septal ring-binding cell division protein DamX
MSDARPDPAAPAPPTSLRQAASSAGLLVVVLAILAWSRFLQSGPPEHRPAASPPPVPSLSTAAPPEGFASLEREPQVEPEPPTATPTPPPTVPSPAPAPAVEPPRDPALAALADRAAADVARIGRKRGGWTLQVSRHCSTPLVQEKLRRHGSANDFFLLPAEHGDKACFVVCWGTYADRASATKGASKVPAALKGDGKPFAKAIAEVLP